MGQDAEICSALNVVMATEYIRAEEVEGDSGKAIHTMNYKGIPVSRWVDGVLEESIGQKDNIRCMVWSGHAVNSQTRGLETKKAMN